MESALFIFKKIVYKDLEPKLPPPKHGEPYALFLCLLLLDLELLCIPSPMMLLKDTTLKWTKKVQCKKSLPLSLLDLYRFHMYTAIAMGWMKDSNGRGKSSMIFRKRLFQIQLDVLHQSWQIYVLFPWLQQFKVFMNDFGWRTIYLKQYVGIYDENYPSCEAHFFTFFFDRFCI